MTKEQSSRASLKEIFQLWIAEIIAGKEFNLLNSILVRLAGKEIQPISFDEINQFLFTYIDNIREVRAYDKDGMGPSAVGLFGLSINQVSEKLHFTRPLLSEQKIQEARETIVRAVEEYGKLKGKLKEITEIKSALFFIKKVKDTEESIGLNELQDYLNKVLLDHGVD